MNLREKISVPTKYNYTDKKNITSYTAQRILKLYSF